MHAAWCSISCSWTLLTDMHWRDCTQCCVLGKIWLCFCCVPACPAGAMHTMDAAVCAHMDTLYLLRPICKCLASGCLSMSLTLSSSMRAGSLCRLSLSQTPARCALNINQVSIISRIPLHGTKLCAFHASTAHLCYIHCEKVQPCDLQHASLISSQLSHCHDAMAALVMIHGWTCCRCASCKANATHGSAAPTVSSTHRWERQIVR